MGRPEKRKAGPAATGHGSKSKSRSQPKNTLRPDGAQALSVYSGQEWLGKIEVRKEGNNFAAFTTTDRFIGVFGSLKAAADAVDAAASGGVR